MNRSEQNLTVSPQGGITGAVQVVPGQWSDEGGRGNRRCSGEHFQGDGGGDCAVFTFRGLGRGYARESSSSLLVDSTVQVRVQDQLGGSPSESH